MDTVYVGCVHNMSHNISYPTNHWSGSIAIELICCSYLRLLLDTMHQLFFFVISRMCGIKGKKWNDAVWKRASSIIRVWLCVCVAVCASLNIRFIELIARWFHYLLTILFERNVQRIHKIWVITIGSWLHKLLWGL